MNKSNVGANTNISQMCIDVIALGLSFMLTWFLIYADGSMKGAGYLLAILASFTVVYILSNKESRLYNVTLFFYFDRFIKIITKSWFIAAMTTAVLLFAFDVSSEVRRFFFSFLVVSYIMLLLDMFFCRFVLRDKYTNKTPRVAYVGLYEEYKKFDYFMDKTSIKYEHVGYVVYDEEEEASDKARVLGKLSELEDIIRSDKVDQIFFLQKSDTRLSDIQPYIDLCMDMGITVKVIIESGFYKRMDSFVSSIGMYPVITYHTISLNNYEAMLKRLMDIIVSFVGIVIASPIMIVTAIAIKKESEGPAIFKQVRVGQNGRQFHIYKFRSMYIDAEERKKELMAQNEMQGLMFKMKDDPRITKVGKFIRKTSIDELPQLFNVLFGSMSLVGTRPPTLDEVEKYNRGHWRRISIKPGITGMWQVSGRNNITDFDEVVKLDCKYIDNWNLLLDIKIMFKTVAILFTKDGAY